MVIDSLSRKARAFFKKAHEDANHFYEDGNRDKQRLGYDFHLELVADVVIRFGKLCGLSTEEIELAIAAAWGHDSVSDARLTFNDIAKGTGSERLAQICCNLCEDVWGKNRDERNSPAYYERIKSDKISVFVKLCDRIANVEYGLWQTNSDSMAVKYLVEHLKFIDSITHQQTREQFAPVLEHLTKIFKTVDSIDGYTSKKHKLSLKMYNSPTNYKLIFAYDS